MQQLMTQYPAEKHTVAGARRAHDAIPHGARAELGDAIGANLTS